MILEYDAATKMSMRVGTALIKAMDEHGVPNTFAFSELVGRADAMAAGKAVRKDWGAFALNVDAQRPGTRVTLWEGRLAVEHVESTADVSGEYYVVRRDDAEKWVVRHTLTLEEYGRFVTIGEAKNEAKNEADKRNRPGDR